MTTATQLYVTNPLALTGTEKVAADSTSTGGATVQDIANLSGAPAVSVEFTTDANLTLTQGQYQAESITFTDSPTTLTAGRDVVFPAHFPTKYVKNSTAQTLTLKKSGQTGVALTAGGTAIVASGATDVVVGPGSAAVTSVNGLTGTVVLGGEVIAEPVNALATSGTIAIDCSLGDYFTLAAAGNMTSFTFSNLPASGKAQTIMVRITQDATGSRVATWPASFKWAGASAGVLSTAANSVDVLAITTFNQGTSWIATLSKAHA
jgi:hypothetical protein